MLSNYSLPKRKSSNQSRRKSKKHSRSNSIDLRSKKKTPSPLKSDDDDDDDCELITLRLNALRSKQELKEPEDENIMSIPEEELLRIDALKSALLKKKDHFAEKKRKRKLEKERPYSPTDDLDKILEDDPMELTTSPINQCTQDDDDDINQMDMDISNSSTPQEDILSDMDLTSSPTTHKTKEEIDNDEEEEKALRSLLLSSISSRRKAEERSVAMNLKLAVERLRQAQHKHEQEQLPSSPQAPVKLKPSKKSGTKTIKMILEEKKNRKLERSPELETQIETENYLLSKITDEQNEAIEKLPTPILKDVFAEENDNLLPSISDTKNIPLISSERSINKNIQKSRILTTLNNRPVEPLIITLNADSSDDENLASSRMVKKTHRKIVRVSNALPKNSNSHQIDMVEKQVESILRTIRLQSEANASQNIPKKSSSQASNVPKASKPDLQRSASLAVNHLPKSAQIEYAMLIEKMKVLEESKAIRQKTRQLKRQKSASSISKSDKESITKGIIPSKKETSPPPITSKSSEFDDAQKRSCLASERIEDTLSKIQLLDEGLRCTLSTVLFNY